MRLWDHSSYRISSIYMHVHKKFSILLVVNSYCLLLNERSVVSYVWTLFVWWTIVWYGKHSTWQNSIFKCGWHSFSCYSTSAIVHVTLCLLHSVICASYIVISIELSCITNQTHFDPCELLKIKTYICSNNYNKSNIKIWKLCFMTAKCGVYNSG